MIELSHDRCGYATIHDVQSKDLEDRMESFFLSETCKYLYLVSHDESGFFFFPLPPSLPHCHKFTSASNVPFYSYLCPTFILVFLIF